VAVAAFCIGFTRAGFGGFGLIAVLLMAQAFPAKESTGAVLPMLIMADFMAISAYRRHVSWGELWRLLPSTFLGLIAGWLLMLLMSRIPDDLFSHFLGWLILVMMALVLWQRFDRRILSGIMHHPVLATGSGFLAGVTTIMANAGGPAMTFYLLAKRFDKMAFVGTCAWFFCITNLVKIPLSWNLGLITISSLAINLMMLPAIVAGMLVGRLLLGKVSQAAFEWVAIIMAIASAARMIMV
jgi:uncharacterized membrane protein YfcA